MKQIIVLIAAIVLGCELSAQTWESKIYPQTGKQRIKTLKLQQKTNLRIGTLTVDTDSLQVDRMLIGSFISGAGDSLQIKLSKVEINSKYENGTKIRTTVPAKNYLTSSFDSTFQMSVSLEDINVLSYHKRIKEDLSKFEDYVLFTSLFVLLASPFICYNYADQTFNQDRYQYWALGSTIGVFTGITLQMMGGQKRLQFKTGWPDEKARVWSFEEINN
jgi:hypothetical protein